MTLELIKVEQDKNEIRRIYKIYGDIPIDFKLKIKMFQYYRISPEFVKSEYGLDPNRYIMYKNSEVVQSFIIIDIKDKVLTLKVPKKGTSKDPNGLTKKTERLYNSLSTWEQHSEDIPLHIRFGPNTVDFSYAY